MFPHINLKENHQNKNSSLTKLDGDLSDAEMEVELIDDIAPSLEPYEEL